MRDIKGRFIKGHPFGKRFQKGHIPWHKGKKGVYTEEVIKKMRLFWLGKRTGPEHPLWKGNNINYFVLHAWVTRKLGKPGICSECGTTTAKRYHWANISGKYLRNISDYKRLCVKCHSHLDLSSHSRGEKHYFSKLTEKDVIKIRDLYSSGKYYYKDLAKKFDVYFTTIHKIVAKESWKHIPHQSQHSTVAVLPEELDK